MPPAMAKPSRQWPSPSAAPSAARGRRELSRRCLSPPGRVSTRPAGRGRSEGTGESRRCGRAFLSTFLVATRKEVARRARPGQSPPRPKAPRDQTAKDQRPWTPACAGRRIVRMPRPKRRQTLGDDKLCSPAMAKQVIKSRQQPSPSAAPSGARAAGPGELSRRCLSPPGRVSTRPAGRGRNEGTGESRRCGRGALLSSFLVATRKVVARRARPGQSPPTEGTPKANDKDQRPWTPACAGATNRARMPCPKRRRYMPPAMAKPSRQWPSPSAAPSAARGRRELSRRCLSP